jgi:hypothetical protein
MLDMVDVTSHSGVVFLRWMTWWNFLTERP